MSVSKEVMRGDIPKLCLLVATLALGSVAVSDGACERGLSWWDRQRGTCLPCTRCDPAKRLVVRYPCEIHRDTICQSLYEAQISPFNTHQVHKKNNESSELVPSDVEYEYVDYDSEVMANDEVSWDLQTTSLSVAASGCVVFFVVVLVMSLYHARQWRVIKRALKSDVHDLTAKLKLMEAGGETTTEPIVAADHHIYCNIHHLGKEALLGGNARVFTLRGSSVGHGGAYGGGVPCLGGALPCLRGGDRRRRPLASDPVSVRSERAWEAVTSFCEAIMFAKEEAGCVKEWQSLHSHVPSRHRRRRPRRRELITDSRSP